MLMSTCNHDVLVTTHDRLGRQHYGFHSRSTYFVDCAAWSSLEKTSTLKKRDTWRKRIMLRHIHIEGKKQWLVHNLCTVLVN